MSVINVDIRRGVNQQGLHSTLPPSPCSSRDSMCVAPRDGYRVLKDCGMCVCVCVSYVFFSGADGEMFLFFREKENLDLQ